MQNQAQKQRQAQVKSAFPQFRCRRLPETMPKQNLVWDLPPLRPSFCYLILLFSVSLQWMGTRSTALGCKPLDRSNNIKPSRDRVCEAMVHLKRPQHGNLGAGWYQGGNCDYERITLAMAALQKGAAAAAVTLNAVWRSTQHTTHQCALDHLHFH